MRQKLIDIYHKTFRAACFYDDKYPYMKCSLDGIHDASKTIWEHKLVSQKVFDAKEPEPNHLVQVLYQTGIVKCSAIILQYTLFKKKQKLDEAEYKYYEIDPTSKEMKKKIKSIRIKTALFWKKIKCL